MDNNKIAIFVINEIMPRAKKLKIPVEEFLSTSVVAWLLECEELGLMYRLQTRKFLESVVEDHKAKAAGTYNEAALEAEFDRKHPKTAAFFVEANRILSAVT
jgi:hypothetical protein